MSIDVVFGPPVYNTTVPALASLDLEIGKFMTTKVLPNHVIKLEYHKFVNGIGQFYMELADPNWTEIEEALIKNRGRIRFRYGYATKPIGLGSTITTDPWFSGLVLNYSTKFHFGAAVLKLVGFSTGFFLNTIQTYSPDKWDQLSISEIVNAIVDRANEGRDEKEKLTAVIEPTEPVMARQGTETTDEVAQIFRQTGETDFQFVLRKLQPLARNTDHQGNYLFFMKTNRQTGNPELHFHTAHYKKLDSIDDKEYAFSLFGNPRSPVIEFEPNWAMSAAQIFGGAKTVQVGIDHYLKETFKVETTVDNTPQKITGTTGFMLLDQKDSPRKSFQASDIMLAPATTQAEAESRVEARFSGKWVGAIAASLTIQGTSFFELTDRIQMWVYITKGPNSLSSLVSAVTPFGSTQRGTPHWISGEFRIVEAIDHIELGRWITNFKLVTTGRSVVPPDSPNLESA